MRHSFNRILQFIFVFTFVSLFGACTTLGQGGGEASDQADKAEWHQQLYVCNQGEATLTVIDMQTNAIVDKIDLKELGFSANAKPHHAVAEPDGSFWYVTLIGENRVLKFNRDNELVGQAEMEVPGLISLHPTKDRLLVGRSMSAVNPPQSLAMINRSKMATEQIVDTFFARPHAIDTTPDGKWTLIASLAQNQILSLNNETGETNLTRFGGQTHVYVDFTISPDGNTLVATGQVTGKAIIMDISNPAEPKVVKTVDVNAQPWHPVYSPDGNYVYFGNKEANTVTVLDMNSQSVDAVIEGEGLAQPHGSALSADGKFLYISNNNRKGTYEPKKSSSTGEPNGTITVINTETRRIVKVIEVGPYPSGIGTRARK